MLNTDMENYIYKIGGSTFLIRIQFKKNANWQGTIQWLELNKTIPFRSVLELIFLLNEAVDKNPAAYGELNFRSWENRSPEVVFKND